MDFRKKAAAAVNSAKQQQLEDSIRFAPSLRRRSWTGELLDLLSALLSQPLLWILLGVSCGSMALLAPLGLLVVIGVVHLQNLDR